MKAVSGLVLIVWLINTPWLLFLIVAATLTALAIVAWTFIRPVSGMTPPSHSWTRAEPRFEWATNPSWDYDNVQEDANDRYGSTGANPSEGAVERALAARVAELLDQAKRREQRLTQLRKRINELELEVASTSTRIRDAVTSGREEVLHAFGHRRDEFERMLGEFARKEQAKARRERKRHDEEQQRQEESAHQRSEQSQRRSRSPKPWWEVLGVSPNAAEEEVRRAYRILAKRLHPDRQATGDAEQMAEINAAKDEAMKRFRKAA
jgi:hypothetical protein